MKKLKMRGKDSAQVLRYFQRSGRPFTVTRTGYSMTVQLSEEERYLFAEGRVNPRTFALFRRMQKEVQAAGVPVVDQAPTYYSFAGIQGKRVDIQRAWCYDLTSAYAQALLNMRLISAETLDKLRRLPKVDRLRAVGMLATQKTVLHYDGRRCVSVDIEHSPTRGAFLAASVLVGEILGDLSRWPGFLFFWVDGAYFSRPAPEVSDHFAFHGFRSTVETVEDLKLSPSGRRLFYLKDGQKKYLSLPHGKRPAPQWMVDLLSRDNGRA